MAVHFDRIGGEVFVSPVMGKIKNLKVRAVVGDNRAMGKIWVTDLQLQVGPTLNGYNNSPCNRYVENTDNKKHYNIIARDKLCAVIPYDSYIERSGNTVNAMVNVSFRPAYSTVKADNVSIRKFYGGQGPTITATCTAGDIIESRCNEQKQYKNGVVGNYCEGQYLIIPPWDNKLQVTPHNHDKILVDLEFAESVYGAEGKRN